LGFFWGSPGVLLGFSWVSFLLFHSTHLLLLLLLQLLLLLPADTANVYTEGDSERFLGQYVAGKRSSTVLASKYTFTPIGMSPNAGKHSKVLLGGNSRKSLVENLDASLKRLGVGYMDLLYVTLSTHFAFRILG